MDNQALLRETLTALLTDDLSKNELKVGIALIIQTIGYGKRTNNLTMKRLANITGINIRGGIDRIEKPIQTLVNNGWIEQQEHKGRDYDYTYQLPEKFFQGQTVERFFAPGIPVTEEAPQALGKVPQSLRTYRVKTNTDLNPTQTKPAPKATTANQTASRSRDLNQNPIATDNLQTLAYPQQFDPSTRQAAANILDGLPPQDANDCLKILTTALSTQSIQKPLGYLHNLAKAARNGTLDRSNLQAQQPKPNNTPNLQERLRTLGAELQGIDNLYQRAGIPMDNITASKRAALITEYQQLQQQQEVS